MEDQQTRETKPKRPLSAYNLFFKCEREVILKDRPVRPEGVPRRGHGKMGFAEMARTIAGKWNTIDQDTKTRFEALAKVEKLKYKKKLAEWKQLCSKATSSSATTTTRRNKNKEQRNHHRNTSKEEEAADLILQENHLHQGVQQEQKVHNGERQEEEEEGDDIHSWVSQLKQSFDNKNNKNGPSNNQDDGSNADEEEGWSPEEHDHEHYDEQRYDRHDDNGTRTTSWMPSSSSSSCMLNNNNNIQALAETLGQESMDFFINCFFHSS